jgi:hypothetical protein
VGQEVEVLIDANADIAAKFLRFVNGDKQWIDLSTRSAAETLHSTQLLAAQHTYTRMLLSQLLAAHAYYFICVWCRQYLNLALSRISSISPLRPLSPHI